MVEAVAGKHRIILALNTIDDVIRTKTKMSGAEADVALNIDICQVSPQVAQSLLGALHLENMFY